MHGGERSWVFLMSIRMGLLSFKSTKVKRKYEKKLGQSRLKVGPG